MATILPFAGIRPRIHPTAFVAPTATVIGNVTVGAEASVWFGAVIRGDEPEHEIRVGPRTSVQDNVVLHVSRRGPTLIGSDVTIGHGAVLESCVVGDGALIGMNAVVLQGATVGAGALVAASATVPDGGDVPARHLAAGTPARVKKELDGKSLGWVLNSAAHYVELSRAYLAQGIGAVDASLVDRVPDASPGDASLSDASLPRRETSPADGSGATASLGDASPRDGSDGDAARSHASPVDASGAARREAAQPAPAGDRSTGQADGDGG